MTTPSLWNEVTFSVDKYRLASFKGNDLTDTRTRTF